MVTTSGMKHTKASHTTIVSKYSLSYVTESGKQCNHANVLYLVFGWKFRGILCE